MAKNLPPIFKIDSDKIPTTHNSNYYYSKDNHIEKIIKKDMPTETLSLKDKLDRVFNTRGYSFNIPVRITFAGKTIDTYLATRTNTSIITLDNESIPLSMITSFEIKDPID